MAIKHSVVKAPGQQLFAVADWNTDHTIEADTITTVMILNGQVTHAKTDFADQNLNMVDSPNFNTLTLAGNLDIRSFWFYDDFVGSQLSLVAGMGGSEDSWQYVGAITVIASPYGVIRLTATAIQGVQFDNGGTSNIDPLAFGDDPVIFEAGIRVPGGGAGVTDEFWIGINVLAGAPLFDESILFHINGLTNVEAFSNTGGLPAETSPVAAIDGQWHRCKFIWHVAGMTIDFYWDDILVTTHNVQMPALPMDMFIQCVTAGANWDVDVDFYKISMPRAY